MKAKTLQVVWHSKQPVFSLDFHPSGLLATGGGDKDVKVNSWRRNEWIASNRFFDVAAVGVVSFLSLFALFLPASPALCLPLPRPDVVGDRSSLENGKEPCDSSKE